MKWKSNCADGIDFSFSLLLLLFSHARIQEMDLLCRPICFTRELMMETEWEMKFLSCLYEKWMKSFSVRNFLPRELLKSFELARFILGSAYALFGMAYRKHFCLQSAHVGSLKTFECHFKKNFKECMGKFH